MASRRLDIGSLLCDDNQPAFSPLQVLVQAATEERKRLGDPLQHPHNPPSDSTQSPLIDGHVAQSPHLSPHLSRHPIDDSQRIHLSQQPLYLQRTRPHHDNLTYSQYQHHSQSSRDFDLSDRRRHLQEAEHQQRLQEQQRIQEIEYHRRQEHERAFRAQELERRRREEDHFRSLEYQRGLERREAERMQQLRTEEKRREADRLRELEEGKQAERQSEIERHRATEKYSHHDKHQYDPERRSFMHPQSFPARLSPVASPASISHLVSNSDPPQIRRSTASISPDSSIPPSHHDPRPVKKRRYSVSPTRHDDQERNARDRDRMIVGELSYGRVDSPLAGPSPPRRPGSHSQPRKAVAVADLLADNGPPPPSATAQLARPEPRDAHKILSPTSRRSPPGSQIGRAKAARKSDEYITALKEHTQPTPTTKDHVQPVLSESIKSTEDSKNKPEPKPNRHRYLPDEICRPPTIDEPRQKKALPPSVPKLQPSNSKSNQRDDPHEFFLHQYDQVATPAKSAKSALPDSGGMPSPSSNPISPTPIINPKNFPTPSTVVALDKELEDLVSFPTASCVPSSSVATVRVKKQEESDDMDLAVDLAVKALVENLENDSEKHISMDVEDELLSLVDDRLPDTTNSSRRPVAPSHVSDLPSQLPSDKQQQQSMDRNSDSLHPSPPTTVGAPAFSSALQAAALVPRPSSARASSDRDSMPPPATTKGGPAKKVGERAGSTVSTEPSATTGGKKKKETATKVCIDGSFNYFNRS